RHPRRDHAGAQRLPDLQGAEEDAERSAGHHPYRQERSGRPLLGHGVRGRRVPQQASRPGRRAGEARSAHSPMTFLDALLLLAAGAATLGIAPVTYVLLRQARGGRKRAAALARVESARALVENDSEAELEELAKRLSTVDAATLDDTIEQLAADADSAERR